MAKLVPSRIQYICYNINYYNLWPNYINVVELAVLTFWVFKLKIKSLM